MEQRGDLVEQAKGFTITPGDIDSSQHFGDAFGNNETEVSAGYIVRMCQEKGSWTPFTDEEIETFYRRVSGRTGRFTFNQLVEPQKVYGIKDMRDGAQEGAQLSGGGWIVKKGDGKYHLTTAFVETIHNSSPQKT